MTVRIVGPWCSRCHTLPALAHGLCSACDRLGRLFGTVDAQPLMSVDDPRFERALSEWRKGRS